MVKFLPNLFMYLCCGQQNIRDILYSFLLSQGFLNDAKDIRERRAFSSPHFRLCNFSSRSSNERKDLSARAVSRRRTLSYFYWFARWGVVKGRQPPVLPPPPVAVSAPLPPLYAREVKREGGERKRKTLLIPASPSFPFGFPTAARSGLSTLGFPDADATKEKYLRKKRNVSPLPRVTLQPAFYLANERKDFAVRGDRASKLGAESEKFSFISAAADCGV